MLPQNAKPDDQSEQKDEASHRVRLPGFIVEHEVGLGDVIKRATYAIGLQPCGGCERRAAKLNRWMSFRR